MELLYTKRGNDYAHMIVENEKNLCIDSFEGIEDSLKETADMGLPFSSEVDDTYAYYFNTVSGELWYAKWCYSTDGDPRGYVESRYGSIPKEVIRKLRVTRPLLEQLCSLLVHTFMLSEPASSKFHKYDLSQLFPDEEMSEDLIRAFLYLYYLLLPTHFSNKVLFINWCSNVRCDMTFALAPAARGERVYGSEAFDPAALELINHIENTLEYQILFEAIIQDVFHDALSFPLDRKTQPLYVRVQRVLSLWHKVGTKAWTSQNCQQLIRKKLIEIFEEEIGSLNDIKNFHDLLEEYQQILGLLHEPENTASLEQCGRGFLFQKYHTTSDEQFYLMEAFQVLSVLGDRILDEDRRHYSDLCLTHVCQAQTARELIQLIKMMDHCSVQGLFTVVSVSEGRQKELEELYDRLSQDILVQLKNYHGYCNDQTFSALKTELDGVMEMADVFGFDFRVFLFNNYAAGLKNTMQFQNMCSFFLDERITLELLLEMLEEWKIEDFFTKVNLTIFDIMLETLKQVQMDGTEREHLLICLTLYKAFRLEYDDIVERSEYQPGTEIELQKLQRKYAQLVQALANVYNHCRDERAIKILVFLCKNIAGNPSILIFMMYSYQQSFGDKNLQEDYEFYFQFFDLIFRPLIMKQELSLYECCNFITMYKQNYIPVSKVAKGGYKLQRWIKKTGFAVEGLDLFKNNMPAWQTGINPDFVSGLEERLGERYNIPIEDRAPLGAEIAAYYEAYRSLISRSQLNELCGVFIELIKKYIICLIHES